VNEAGPVKQQGPSTSSPVFISYASRDRVKALRVTDSIESRGTSCWISTRDVAPGENYQEAIVRALRAAPAMVLIFSKAANDSDEIKKELSLASRFRIPVIALRLEEVEPSDAFAYELSTRQWIDAFDGWPRAMDLLDTRIAELSGLERSVPGAPAPAGRARRSAVRPRRSITIGATVLLLLLVAAGTWWRLRPPPAAAHALMVRLAGFQRLSADLPATLPAAVDAEIAAAFNADGVVGVSTAPTPAPGRAPAYAVRGTIARNGDAVRVITNLVNEHSGATPWSRTFTYDGSEVPRIPRHIAVDAGNVVRCGLFGASTYHKPLPDTVLRDYMQSCQAYWDTDMAEGRKGLLPAERVVAAVPDFSWGWAAVAGAYWKIAMSADTPEAEAEARAKGSAAADKAVAIDPRNSEALFIHAMLLKHSDWLGREKLLKKAVGAQRLDCGCEHHQYGWMLHEVGRLDDALEQLRQANDMLALYIYTPLTLAEALVADGKADEARKYYEAAQSLAANSDMANSIAYSEAAATGDVKALLDPKLMIQPAKRAALVKGYRAVASRDPAAKARAAQVLRALPEESQDQRVAELLGALGANHQAFQIAARLSEQAYGDPALLWYRDMRGALSDPGVPALVTRLGLMNYWKQTKTRPDVCKEPAAPPFCAMIQAEREK
jgi:tetratricopeptide (TPR) repeat protein